MPKQENRGEGKARRASAEGVEVETGRVPITNYGRPSRCSFVLVDLGIPSFLQFLVVCEFALGFAEFHLESFACAQNLTLKVETAALFGVVDVEQLLEPARDMFQGLFAARGGLDVENLASLFDTQVRGCESATGGTLLTFIFSGCLRLLVGFGEGAAEDTGSGDDDLRDDAMSLDELVMNCRR
jgi:hypothetical protein